MTKKTTAINKTTEFYLYLSILIFSIVCIISSIVIIVQINDTSKNPKEEINSLKKTIETLFWIFAIFFFFFVIPVVPLISIFIYSKLVSKDVKESVKKFGSVVNEKKFFCSLIAVFSLILLILFWVSKDIVNDNNIEDENKCDYISNNGIGLLSVGLVIITITLPKLYKLYPEYEKEKEEIVNKKFNENIEKASLEKKKQKQIKEVNEANENYRLQLKASPAAG
jgi:magnesium-transporting ATPase (P-type)